MTHSLRKKLPHLEFPVDFLFVCLNFLLYISLQSVIFHCEFFIRCLFWLTLTSVFPHFNFSLPGVPSCTLTPQKIYCSPCSLRNTPCFPWVLFIFIASMLTHSLYKNIQKSQQGNTFLLIFPLHHTNFTLCFLL